MSAPPATNPRLLVPLAMAAAMLAVLVGLGVWQIQRGQEKKLLIAALDARLAMPPVALPPPEQWPALRARDDEFRRVTFSATFLPVEPALVFTSASALRTDVRGTGFWVFAPARLASGRIVIVNRGFVADTRIADADRGLPPDRTLTLTGYLRFDEEPGLFTPEPVPSARRWYARTSTGMARALGWGDAAPFYVDMEAPPPQGAGPRPGTLAPRLADNHFQYAATWFALALIVLVLTGVWIRSAQRRRD